MTTDREDYPAPQEDATPPPGWPEESAGLHESAASAAAAEEPDHQTIEEPGYGHGVGHVVPPGGNAFVAFRGR